MRKLIILTLLFAAGSAGWAIPNVITYQGTLKDKGLPANNPPNDYTMTFTLTDSSGTTPYSSGINITHVPVSNGLFSVTLNFQLLSPNTWESISPYLKVNVNGQDLGKPEPVNATAYAIVSNTVVDGAITQTKLAAPVAGSLIPSGMIAMFHTNCPSGWTRFSALDNNFPMGSSAYGTTGGSSTHSHSLTITSTVGGGGSAEIGTTRGATNNGLSAFGASGANTVDLRSADTDARSNLPPYLTMIFCEKN
jgi:hypothetical protein